MIAAGLHPDMCTAVDALTNGNVRFAAVNLISFTGISTEHFCWFVLSFVRFFGRPFTPRGWLPSVRNFAKTRFRRFPTFDFSTPKRK